MRRNLLLALTLSAATALAGVARAEPVVPGAPPRVQDLEAQKARDAEAPQPAPATTPAVRQPSAPAPEPARERLVDSARRHLRVWFSGDCSGFVRRVYAEAQVALPLLAFGRTMSEALYRSMVPVLQPKPGDLAFFDGTRRKDHGRKVKGRFTHVAIVESVDGSRVTLIHRERKGIRRLTMNVERPHDRAENGVLRTVRRRDGGAVPSLAGELFVGYASALWNSPMIQVEAEDLEADAEEQDADSRP